MSRVIKKVTWWIFAFMSVCIGLYPLIYFVVDRHFGLLSTKSQELLTDGIWNVAFYGHIILGGIALLIGWTQFSSKLRRTRISLHRTIGKVYVLAALISGVCGIYIAQFATGGIINVIAFSLSGIIWIGSTFMAYRSIKNGEVVSHQNFMIYSYAVCFSAVTLRIWLPILVYLTGGFNTAYLLVGWISWVPNMIVAYFIINKISNSRPQYIKDQLIKEG